MIKKINLLSVFFLLVGVLPVFAQNGAQKLTVSNVTNGTFSQRSAGLGFRPTADGKHYTIISKDRKSIVRYNYETGRVVDTLFNSSKARECDFDTFQNYIISPNGLRIIILRDIEYIYRRSYKATAFFYDVRRNMVQPLSSSEGKVRIPTFSPDGRMCSYVKEDNNIYIRKFDYNTESQVTTDGKVNEVLNGVTDWVYEEELYVTNLMQWSGDSKQLVFVKTNEADVAVYNMQIWGNKLYPYDYKFKYPKAGEDNSITSLHSFDIMSKKTTPIELPITDEYYIARLDYAHGALHVFTLNRNQNHFRLFTVNPQSTVSKLLLEEKDERYIDPEWVRQLTYTPDGFLYVSERGGYAQLYRYNKQGIEIGKITADNIDVTNLYGVTKSGEVIYSLASPTPMDRVILAQQLKNNKIRFLSPENGYSSAVFSGDMSYYLLTSSDVNTPTRYSLNRTSDAKEMVLLEDNRQLQDKLKDYTFGKKEFISVTTQQGITLNGYMITPSDFDPNKKYPALFVQYSGPNSQEALNRFGFDWTYLLPEEGIIVVCLDGRGTGGRGTEFRKCTYLNMGLIETEDQCQGALAVTRKYPFIDRDRLGIWGWSFGGYTTLMCMTQEEQVFKTGIAVAPPTDWRFYDTTYTERFMRTPQENPDGYNKTSVINRVENFKGNLLLVHGSADDNVHLQNSMLLIKELVKHDKYFELLVYPDKNHSIYGGNTRNHLYNNKLNFLLRNL